MTDEEHKEICRMFWIVKGHLTANITTMRDCYDGYFKRMWGNHEVCYRLDGFEEAYKKLLDKQQ
jgi:hypothetical protein